MDFSGIIVYLGKNEGFRAKIKAVPEDFIVEELSEFLGGNSVAVTDPPSANGNLKRGLQDEEHLIEKRPRRDENESDIALLTTDTLEFNNDKDWCEKRLRNYLTEETYTKLQNYAKNSVKISESSEECLILGEFTVRTQRTEIHRCTRYLYPFLKTVTTPKTGVVSIKGCPNYHKFSAVIGCGMTDELFRFILVESEENLKDTFEIGGDFSKETRRQIHHLISSSFGKFMEARTLPPSDDQDNRIISVRRKPYFSKDKKSDQVITAFTLWKRNFETYAAIHHLGRHLGVPHNMFNFAGIKDRKAITSQKCTVCGIPPDKLEKWCSTLPDNLKVTDAYPVSRVIHLGELIGNRFCIKLSSLQSLGNKKVRGAIQEDVHAAVENVKVTGFVNYFGPQRFGCCIADNEKNPSLLKLEAPAVGLALLQNDFMKAVKILLSPTQTTNAFSTNVNMAKMHYQSSGNVEETLDMMPSFKLREIEILRTLKRLGSTDSDACAKALFSLPHSARLLYVHSFCSLIWNEMASRRIQKFGPGIIPGDLAKKSDGKVSVVTEEDISKGVFSTQDIVLPIPGYQVQYPPCLKDDYDSIMLKYLKTVNHPFRIPKLKLNAPGAYRRLLQYPKNMSYRFVMSKNAKNFQRHEHSEQQLSSSEIKGVAESSNGSADGESIGTMNESPANIDFEDGALYDVEIKFDLPPSCYATTLLDEISKGNIT